MFPNLIVVRSLMGEHLPKACVAHTAETIIWAWNVCGLKRPPKINKIGYLQKKNNSYTAYMLVLFNSVNQIFNSECE